VKKADRGASKKLVAILKKFDTETKSVSFSKHCAAPGKVTLNPRRFSIGWGTHAGEEGGEEALNKETKKPEKTTAASVGRILGTDNEPVKITGPCELNSVAHFRRGYIDKWRNV
jgi:hypothetical protein